MTLATCLKRQVELEVPGPGIELLLQPETRPISHAQLAVEVKGIYAGLVMVEAKCIDVDDIQSIHAQEPAPGRQCLNDEQWRSLIALHKTLLHEHHDFFLASQHPSASPELFKLATKYSMPARMWRHGIHAFLEVLRHRLPGSLDHMLAFIYIAYSIMALLYETFTTFEETWIECLGDLARYRMAIEDDKQADREMWSGIVRSWYSKGAHKAPTVGRLYHHLAILARPYSLEQLRYYTDSLTVIKTFDSARASMMTLFQPVLDGKNISNHRSMELAYIKAHGILFVPPHDQKLFQEVMETIRSGMLDCYIDQVTANFKKEGVYDANSNSAALFEYCTRPVTSGALHWALEIAQTARVSSASKLLAVDVVPLGTEPDSLTTQVPARPASGEVRSTIIVIPKPTDIIPRGLRKLKSGKVPSSHVFGASIWSDFMCFLKFGLTLLILTWTSMLHRMVGYDEKNQCVPAEPGDPPAVCICQQYAACPVDDALGDEDLSICLHTDSHCSRIDFFHWCSLLAPSTLSSVIPGQSRSSLPGPFVLALSYWGRGALRSTVFLAYFSQLSVAMPAPTSEVAVKTHSETSASSILFADLAAVMLVLLVLGTAQLLVIFKMKPLPVWATLMACSAFGWWCIRSDVTTSLVLSCAVFFVWLISSYQYGQSAFEGLQAPSYMPLVIIAMSIALDVCIVGYMTPIEAAISQTDLLNLSLPSASLVLAVAAVGLSAYRHQYPEPGRSESGSVPQQVP
ncbi:MAG: hypothetical protein Q9218_002465 [Villophora microphyllina]